MHSKKFLPLPLFFVLSLSFPCMADESYFLFRMSVDISRGDYGTGVNTTTASVPFTLSYVSPDIGEVSITIPYIFQSTTFVTAGERGFVVRRPRALARVSGMGDIELRGRYYLVDESWLPGIDITGLVKFPTAPVEKSLGTGEYDYGAGAGFFKQLSSFILLLDLEYIVKGDPPGVDLRNKYLFSLGAGYPATGRLTPYIFYNFANATVKGSDNSRELVLVLGYRLTEDVSIDGSVAKGLSDGSPDYSIGAAFDVRF